MKTRRSTVAESLIPLMRPVGVGEKRLTLAHRRWELAGLVLFGILLAFVVLCFQDYGITWDEWLRNAYGEAIVRYYLSGLENSGHANLAFLYLSPSMVDALFAGLTGLLNLPVFETRHLLMGLLGVSGVLAVWKIGYWYAGPRAAFLSAVLLASTPIYLGHIFANPVDVPAAVFHAWSLYYLLLAFSQFPVPDRGVTVKLGLAIGATMAVRFNIVFPLFYLAVGFLLYAGLVVKEASWTRRLHILKQSLVRCGIPAGVIAYSLVLVFWPWAQQSPLIRPIEALFASTSFDEIEMRVLFAGKILTHTDLPRDYLPVHLGIQLPLYLLVLIVTGVIGALNGALRRRRVTGRAIMGYGLLLMSAVFPASLVILMKTTLYDTFRHMLFIVPPLAVMGGLGGNWLWVTSEPWPRWLRGSIAVAAVAWLGGHAATLGRLHPYEYVYYNSLVGGVPGAAGKYEVEYWGASLREAVASLKERIGARPARVSVCGHAHSAVYYFPDEWTFVEDPADSDFMIALAAYALDEPPCWNAAVGTPFIEISRMGVAFSFVYDLRGDP